MSKRRGKRSLDRLPLLWKHMLMMVCVLALALTALGFSNRQSLETMTQEQLSKFDISLERDCDQFSSAMNRTIAIPDGVEGTRFYNYIKGVNDGYLADKYYPVLNYLRKALNNQVYLQQASAETGLYLCGTNSIVTNQRNFPNAEDCFEQYLKFSQTGIETLLGYLRERNSVTILPMQPVKLGDNDYEPCLCLIIHPINSNTAVLSIYTQETVLEQLGFSYLPQGSALRLTAKDGQVLFHYPGTAEENCYLLTGTMKDFQIQVELWIPRDYFRELLRPVRLTGFGSMILVAVLGLALSYVLSRVSVRPIRQLLSDHGQSEAAQVNEITQLDHLLQISSQQSRDLRDRLTGQLLARALSGAVLSQREEDALRQALGDLVERYQVAILHSSRQITPGLRDHLQNVFPGAAAATLNDKETGLLLPAGEDCLETLKAESARLNTLPDSEIHCGVSAPAERLESLHIAVRQARTAIPQDQGVRLFPGESVGGGSVSWLQHERLYQSIFSGDETEARRLLGSIAAQSNHVSGREAYYNVRFVLRSAAEELEIPVEEDREYALNLLPGENILSLEQQLDSLFRGLDARRQENLENFHSQILAWVRQNLADYDLSAPRVAERFGIPEKRVYEIIRKETEMTFREYLTDLRMQKAARLLRSSVDGIAEIAQSCGYHSSSTFYRLFQETYSMSPGQYRKECGE